MQSYGLSDLSIHSHYSSVRGQLEPCETVGARWIVIMLFCALPFIQMGISYNLSVQYFAFVVVALGVAKRLALEEWMAWSFVFLAMLLGLFWHLDADTLSSSILRSAREALGVLLIMCAARNASWVVSERLLKSLLIVMVGGLFLLTLVQFVSYSILKSPRFFVPANFYIAGEDTLASRWLAVGSAHGFLADIRVSATFSEPSYLGFVCLSLAALIRSSGLMGQRFSKILILILLVTIALSKSASGIMLFVLLVAYEYRTKIFTVQRILLAMVILAAVLPIAALLLKFNPMERLFSITDPRIELSGYIRLIMPLKHIVTVLTESPFGVPWSELYHFFLQRAGDYTAVGPVEKLSGMWVGQDNGLLNLFIEFGWCGLVVIGALVFVIRDKFILLFLLFVMQFNGAVFSPDKVVIVCLAISCRAVAARLTAPTFANSPAQSAA